MRRTFSWRLRTRQLALGERTLVMGVINVTPDSFSDGGLCYPPPRAIEHALRLLDEGADILDIGGESTRPGATAVSAEEELARVLPVLEGVLRARPQAVVSIDTYKAQVASAALAAGAEIVNDVSGFTWDAAMRSSLAGSACGAVLMHTRGRPEEWRALPPLAAPVELVCRELAEVARGAESSGIRRERLVLDPGLGFGKAFDENYPLLARLEEIAALGYPLLVGPSRKSFLGRTLGFRGAELGRPAADAPASARLHATLAAVTAGVLYGAHIVRVHDVGPAVEVVAIADAILRAG